MINFRDFLLESEELKNVKTMIAKLPKSHAKLLDGYKFRYQGGNTMKGDDENIGQIYQDKITVAAPWSYGREFTTLHEIGHLIFEYVMTPKLKKEWSALLKKTLPLQKQYVKDKGESIDALDQNEEEIFAMSYAATYCKHAPIIFHNEKWIYFIKKIV